MNTTNEKQELIDRIQETNDETLIQDLRAIIDDRSTDITWHDLPDRVKEDVRTAQAQAKAGEGMTSEEMWKELKRRQNNRA